MSLSGSVELFNTAIGIFQTDLNIYSQVGVNIVRTLLTAVSIGKANASFAKTSSEELKAVDDSILKKLIDMPSGTDLIAFAFPSAKMNIFSKYFYEHGEIPFVSITQGTSFVVLAPRSELTSIHAAVRACEERLESKDTLLLSNDILQAIRTSYISFSEENKVQKEREEQIAKKDSNRIQEVLSVSGDVSLSPVQIENILNISRNLLAEVQQPSENSFERIKSQDFIRHLVEPHPTQDSVTKSDLSTLSKNLNVEKEKNRSVNYKNSRLSHKTEQPILHIDGGIQLPFVKKVDIAYDYLLKTSDFFMDIVESYSVSISSRQYIGLNSSDLPEFFKKLSDNGTYDLNNIKDAVCHGNKDVFSRQITLLNLAKPKYNDGRKPYQVRLHEAEEASLDVVPIKEKARLVKDILGEI